MGVRGFLLFFSYMMFEQGVKLIQRRQGDSALLSGKEWALCLRDGRVSWWVPSVHLLDLRVLRYVLYFI